MSVAVIPANGWQAWPDQPQVTPRLPFRFHPALSQFHDNRAAVPGQAISPGWLLRSVRPIPWYSSPFPRNQVRAESSLRVDQQTRGKFTYLDVLAAETQPAARDRAVGP